MAFPPISALAWITKCFVLDHVRSPIASSPRPGANSQSSAAGPTMASKDNGVLSGMRMRAFRIPSKISFISRPLDVSQLRYFGVHKSPVFSSTAQSLRMAPAQDDYVARVVAKWVFREPCWMPAFRSRRILAGIASPPAALRRTNSSTVETISLGRPWFVMMTGSRRQLLVECRLCAVEGPMMCSSSWQNSHFEQEYVFYVFCQCAGAESRTVSPAWLLMEDTGGPF